MIHCTFLCVRLFSDRPRYQHHRLNCHCDVTNQTIRVMEHYGIEERRRYNQEKAKARWWSINFLLDLNV